MLLYAITARALFHGNEQEKYRQLIQQAQHLAGRGVAFLQIREKDLSEMELASLAEEIVSAVRSEDSNMRILLNGPAKIALRTGCDGIHIPASASAEECVDARQVFADQARLVTVSAACHSLKEVEERRQAVDLLLFAPVFEKSLGSAKLPGVGLPALSAAIIAAQDTPVIALGGITPRNTNACLQAGAAGIAGIRLFMTDDWLPLADSR